MPLVPTSTVRFMVRSGTDVAPGDLHRAVLRTASLTVSDRAMLTSSPATPSDWRSIERTPVSTALFRPWDDAHKVADELLHEGINRPFVEPDHLQRVPFGTRPPDVMRALAETSFCTMAGFDPNWPHVPNPPFAWHLGDPRPSGDGFSQLRAARRRAGALPITSRVRIGHLDTGYDPGHASVPEHLRPDMAWNFVENNNLAVDPAISGFLDNPGHGTATLAILAGKRVARPVGAHSFDDYVGGAPEAEVVPVRIANSVVHFWTSSMAAGIDHAVGWGCSVISISMGGVPTQRWADAVNNAYSKGTLIVAAAGNNVGGFPTRNIVWPARFTPCIAVCGVTAERQRYERVGFSGMMGNFGPASAMRNAICAFTPNIIWAKIGCPEIFDMDGGGTSSATPQVAAAAALYIQVHANALSALSPRARVDAVKHALFSSADKTMPGFSIDEFGNGILRADDALGVRPAAFAAAPPVASLRHDALAEVSGFAKLPETTREMFEVESLQVSVRDPAVELILQGIDPTGDLTSREKRTFATAIARSKFTSRRLRDILNTGGIV